MSGQMWLYGRPEVELQPAGGSVTCTPVATQGPTNATLQPIQTQPYMQPVYPPPTSLWDAQGLSHHMPLNAISANVLPTNVHNNSILPPFAQASLTPLSQISGSGIHPYNQMVPQPITPPILPSMPPPQPEIPPPLPMVPPPPCSPPPPPPPPTMNPPPPATEPSDMISGVGSMPIQWQGTLSKSGVHYCNIYAHRVDSDLCKYTISMSEPSG